MKRLLLAAVLGFGALPAAAQDNAAIALDFMRTCIARFPETRETVAILKSEGWRYESTDGNYHFYSQNGRRVLAGTAVTSSTDQGCFVAVSKLDEKNATAMAAVIAKEMGFTAVDNRGSKDVAPWAGKVRGKNIMFGAVPPSDFYVMRGAGIALVAE